MESLYIRVLALLMAGALAQIPDTTWPCADGPLLSKVGYPIRCNDVCEGGLACKPLNHGRGICCRDKSPCDVGDPKRNDDRAIICQDPIDCGLGFTCIDLVCCQRTGK